MLSDAVESISVVTVAIPVRKERVTMNGANVKSQQWRWRLLKERKLPCVHCWKVLIYKGDSSEVVQWWRECRKRWKGEEETKDGQRDLSPFSPCRCLKYGLGHGWSTLRAYGNDGRCIVHCFSKWFIEWKEVNNMHQLQRNVKSWNEWWGSLF